MITLTNLVLLGAISLLVYKLWQWLLYRRSLALIPGPPSSEFLRGNQRGIHKMDAGVLHEQWRQEYGNIYLYHSYFGVSQVSSFRRRCFSQLDTVMIILTDQPNMFI